MMITTLMIRNILFAHNFLIIWFTSCKFALLTDTVLKTKGTVIRNNQQQFVACLNTVALCTYIPLLYLYLVTSQVNV